MSYASDAAIAQALGYTVQPAESVLHAGWHNFDNIPTLTGLAGTFYWPENPALPTGITFTFTPGMEGSQGTYVRRFGAFVIEQGNLFCVPNNPAIGFAFINLQPMGGGPIRSFVVQGMFTDAAHKISYMLLTHVTAQGQPMFIAFRTA